MDFVHMVIRNYVWRLEGGAGRGMDSIGIFLASDVGWYGASDFRAWLLDREVTEMEGNYSLLIRKETSVLINCKYAEDFYAESHEFPVDALSDLLLQWQKICEMRGLGLAGAYITYNGTRFHIDPQFSSMPVGRN